MRINHNIAALNTYRQLSTNTANGSKALEKLSSGLRINRAGDDAAGLAISEKMRGQIRGLDQAARNSQDAISMIQTAEGALNETHSILQRMRELATQSANGTNTDADRSRIQDEINQLSDEINRIGNNTEFNTQKLINGSKNKTEAAAAVKNSSSISAISAMTPYEVRSASTAGTGTGTAIDSAVVIHTGKSGYYVAGKATSDASPSDNTTWATAITTGSNELTISISGVVRTIQLDETAANDADVMVDFQTKLQTAFNRAANDDGVESGSALINAASITVGLDGLKLKITDGEVGANSAIKIIGGNASGVFFDSTDSAVNGEARNDQMQVKYIKNGVEKTVNITLTAAAYNTPDALAAHISTRFDAAVGADGDGDTTTGDITFTANSALGSKIQMTTGTNVGSNNYIKSFTGMGAVFAGLSGATFEAGKDKNDEFSVTVDGVVHTGINLAAMSYTNKDVLAQALQTAINNKIIADAGTSSVTVKALSVADTDRVRFQVTSELEGATSQIKFNSVSGSKGLENLGFNTTSSVGADGQDAAVSYHVGANAGQNLQLAYGDMRTEALGITSSASGAGTVTLIDNTVEDVNYSSTNTVDNGGDTEYVISVTDKDSADKAVTIINNAIEVVSKERSKLGALQNRLEHTINNLGTASENLTAAESRIRDVDMAKEMMEFTKNNILSQAAQAMLAQANQQPQGVLQLLR